MRVPGDLGFRGLSTLFFFFLVSVVGFLIKRTWRNSVEKQREIMRLVAMASEESARVELEAAHEYGTVSPVVKLSQCAVCYCPTTTRCSRCKAVRYCSGKCQIIHWRQGHKEECNPPTNSFQFNDPGSDFDQCSGSQEQKLYGSSLEDDGKVGPFVDAEETHMGSESFIVSSFVGTTSESSADVSVAEVPFSSRPDSLDVPVFDNIFHDGQYTAVNSKESEFSASQSSSRLDTIVNDMLCSRTSKQTAPSCIVGEADSESTNSVPSNINISSVCMIPKPSTVHSDFWEGTFDSYESGKNTCDNSTPSSFSEAGEDILVKSKSPLHFSSSLSKHADCNSRPLRPETEDHLSDDENHLTLQNKKPTDRVSQTEKNNSDASTLKSLPKEKRSLSSTSDEKPSSTIGEYSFQNVKSSVVDSVNRVPASSSEVSHPSLNVSTGLKTSVRKVVHQFKSSKHSKHNSVGMGSEIVEKCNNKMLFPYELFVKLYHWNKLELRPCGLVNCGNSCYANAVLQCLAFTRPLTAYLLQGLHSKACPKKEWCFTCEFEHLILKAKEGKSPLSPMRILSQLHSIGSQLGHGREEDAHEFLRYAIDTMQSVCLKEAGEDAVGPLAEETTLIGLIFGGYLRSKIKCMKCHWKSERPERMMDLTVEIQGDIGTLDEALRQFTTTEILDGENKYHCSRCKSYEKAKKKLTVLEAPNVLTIALKRFQCGKFGKLNKSVQFPEILNLAPYMSGTSDKSPIYRLYAVVVHLDVMNASFSGHYVCYVSNMLGKWFKIEDSTVKPVELERVLSKGAYMLLYSRCSPRAPSLKRNTILFEESKISRSSHCSEAIRSSYNGNNTSCRERPNSTFSRTGSYAPQRRPEDYSCWAPLDSPATFESFDPFDRRFHPLHRIPKVDSTSDSSSLLSNSDEGSCSTESTRDSIDDCSDYIFGEAGRSWNYPLRVMEDYDGSSSPLFRKTKPSPIAVPSSFPETSGYPSYRREMMVEADSTMQPLKSSDGESLHDKGNHPFLHSDTSKQCRKLTDSSKSSSNSSSSRETDLEKLGWCNPWEAKHGVSQRKSSRDRTTQTKY